MKRLAGYFAKGLLVFVPVALTVFAIILVFEKLDTLFGGLFKIETPGIGAALGVAVTLIFITVIGFIASNFIGNWFFGLVDRLFARVPLVKLVYSSLKDFISAFAGDKKSFDKPVLVELTAGGPRAVGFITREDLSMLDLPGDVAVYFPQSYNFAGSVLIFPRDRVKTLHVDSSTAMTFIVSGGVAGPGK